LDFTNEGNLFAQSKMELHRETEFKLNRWLEQVVDSSRYFALKIQGAGGREATIGFGFRDRDMATDLRESLQHYERSITREKNAKTLEGSFSVPKLVDGETIHINLAGKSSPSRFRKEQGGSGSGVVPLLKRPPAPVVLEGDSQQESSVGSMTDSMGKIEQEHQSEPDDDEWGEFSTA
jgi:adaptin ear-binding coat-associated protein 1/2